MLLPVLRVETFVTAAAAGALLLFRPGISQLLTGDLQAPCTCIPKWLLMLTYAVNVQGWGCF